MLPEAFKTALRAKSSEGECFDYVQAIGFIYCMGPEFSTPPDLSSAGSVTKYCILCYTQCRPISYHNESKKDAEERPEAAEERAEGRL